MRAFIALQLPCGFADETAGLARQLSSAVAGRFSPRENYHLTLAFLGEIGEAQARDAIAALDAACAEAEPIELRPEGLGHFGRPSDATLWLGMVPTDGLRELCDRVRTELARVGVSFDDKPFRPHITLARRARLPRGPLPELVFPLPAQTARVALFKSTLTQDGPIYKELHTVEFDSAYGYSVSSSIDPTR